jgi:hypothetical protein
VAEEVDAALAGFVAGHMCSISHAASFIAISGDHGTTDSVAADAGALAFGHIMVVFRLLKVRM